MAIFKRSEKQADAPQAKVFTPDDLGALSTPAPATSPAVSAPTLEAPPPPPPMNPAPISQAAPQVDAVMGTPNGGSGTPTPQPVPVPSMPVSPFEEASPAPQAAPPTPPAPVPSVNVPVQTAPVPEPSEASQATAVPDPEPLAPPPPISDPVTPIDSDEFTVSAPSAVMPQFGDESPEVGPAVYSTDSPVYTEPEASHVDPGMQDLAHRVSQALVDLEELRGQKEDLESQLAALQRGHADLDRKIEQQRKVVTELLAQVHKVIVGDEPPKADRQPAPEATPRPRRRS